jgi:hypothetical protein
MDREYPRPPDMGETIAWMYDFWSSKFAGARLPMKSDIDPLEIGSLNPGILRQLCLFDVERDPYRFRYRLVGGAIPDAGGLAKPGLYVDQVDPTGLVDAELVKICETGSPWYKIGPAMIAHMTNIAAVESIALPLAGRGGRIDYLLSCTVYHWEKGYRPAERSELSIARGSSG